MLREGWETVGCVCCNIGMSNCASDDNIRYSTDIGQGSTDVELESNTTSESVREEEREKNIQIKGDKKVERM